MRFAHTDIKVPDFSDYRKDSTKRATARAQSAEERKAFTYLIVGGELELEVHLKEDLTKTLCF